MEKAIRQFEAQYALELPAQLQEALLSNQIADRQGGWFETEDRKVVGWITQFWPVESDDSESYASEYKQLSLNQMLPCNLLSIALVANNDRIVISLDGADRGHVYYWAWSEEPDPETNSYQYLRRIAVNFDKFLAALREKI